MRLTKLLMLAGLAVAGVGGAAVADPCGPVIETPVAYARPVEYVRPVVVPRVVVRDGWYGHRYARPYRPIVRERAWRAYGPRTARSYRRGSRW